MFKTVLKRIGFVIWKLFLVLAYCGFVAEVAVHFNLLNIIDQMSALSGIGVIAALFVGLIFILYGSTAVKDYWRALLWFLRVVSFKRAAWVLGVGLAVIVITVGPQHIYFALRYHVSPSAIVFDQKPRDCDWGYSPLGDKGCHYKRRVDLNQAQDYPERVSAVEIGWDRVVE